MVASLRAPPMPQERWLVRRRRGRHTTRRTMRAEEEFVEFARARMPHLYRSAWLLCGDPYRAEDLTQETLAKVYAAWGPRLHNPAAYAHTTLVRTYISAQRRRSSH